MKCIDVKENLDALLDGEAGILNEREIENHLETCGSCRVEFENLSAIGGILKNNLAISAPTILDEKVFSGFDSFHAEKPKPTKEKIGWFGIPRFAFAAALLLFAIGITSAFQLGKMSASKISVVLPEVAESKDVNQVAEVNDANQIEDNLKTEKPIIKIIEVPVIKEKIVEVPVIKEKVITRTVYIEKNRKTEKENKILPNSTTNNDVAMESSIKENGYVTQTDLKGFQPVSQVKIKITRKEE